MVQHVLSRRQILAESLAVIAAAKLIPGLSRPGVAATDGQMKIVVTEPSAGLAAITDVRITNGRVDVPQFAAGTTGPVVVTATKIDRRKPTNWSFVTVDAAGKRKRWA